MLSKDQINILKESVESYRFPCIYYDFVGHQHVECENMLPVEKYIKNNLTSKELELVKNGLSNVLYWGYANVGNRATRVERFRNEVTQEQLFIAAQLFSNIQGDSLRRIKEVGLPEFSGMSFITKVRMFLDPDNYVILDKQILRMRNINQHNLLNNINFGENQTQIGITNNNVLVYLKWFQKCKEISASYYSSNYCAVDIERGFFTLVQRGKVELASEILSMA
jgi:hypothetical protein